MTRSETVAQYFGLSYRVIKRQIDGLTHEEGLTRRRQCSMLLL